MLPAELFQGRAEAHLHYASGLSPEEADTILRAQLVVEEAGNSWTAAPGLWVAVATRTDEQLERQGTDGSLLALLAERLIGVPISLHHHDILPQVVLGLVRAPATEASTGPVLQRLLGWYAETAKAGDAGLMAELLGVARQELSLAAIMLEEQRKLGDAGKDMGFVEILHFLMQLSRAGGRSPSEEEKAEALQLQAELPRRTGLLRCFVPVARWLLKKGAAELRRPERASLLPTVLECLVEGDPVEQQLALHYISLNPHPEQGFWRLQKGLLWHTAEQVLAQGAPGPLVCELAATMFRGSWTAEDCVLPIARPQELPHARRALLRGLVDGRFDGIDGRLVPAAWHAAFSNAPDEELTSMRFSQLETLASALEHLYATVSPAKPPDPLVHMLAGLFGKPTAQEVSPALADWARFLSREWIRLSGLNKQLLEVLVPGAEHPLLAGAIKASFQEAIASSRPAQDTALALRILDEAPATPGTLRSVLALRLAAPRFVSQKPGRHLSLLEEFRRIIYLPWSEPVFGVDVGRLLHEDQVRDVRFTQLKDEELVHIGDGWLSLHEAPFQGMAETIEDEEELLATATLYFLHEWFHVHQGIGQKWVVEQQRETGSESTLMHLDLSADHVAACMAHQAVPRWDLAELKGHQSRLLLGYRAGRGHTAASRSRKTTRLVSLRLDYLVHTAASPPAWLDKLRDGYAFADFSPGGGAMLLLAMGPPVSVLAHTQLSPAEVTLVTTAMDEGNGVEDRLTQIDDLLRRSFNLS